jgi:BCCT family betaine/carnitine transporter
VDANVDKTNFVATLVIILLVSVPLALYPELGARVMQDAYAFIATNFGWLYLLAGVAALLLLMWLAFGRYGAVRLGTAGEKPEFSTYSWVAMLFCAGIGAGLMYWSAIEWAYYYEAPPFGAEPKSVEAAKWASSYGVFHWGFIAWAFYCLPTLAIAYPFYAKRVPVLKYSVACHYWLEGREENIFCASNGFPVYDRADRGRRFFPGFLDATDCGAGVQTHRDRSWLWPGGRGGGDLRGDFCYQCLSWPGEGYQAAQ